MLASSRWPVIFPEPASIKGTISSSSFFRGVYNHFFLRVVSIMFNFLSTELNGDFSHSSMAWTLSLSKIQTIAISNLAGIKFRGAYPPPSRKAAVAHPAANLTGQSTVQLFFTVLWNASAT